MCKHGTFASLAWRHTQEKQQRTAGSTRRIKPPGDHKRPRAARFVHNVRRLLHHHHNCCSIHHTAPYSRATENAFANSQWRYSGLARQLTSSSSTSNLVPGRPIVALLASEACLVHRTCPWCYPWARGEPRSRSPVAIRNSQSAVSRFLSWRVLHARAIPWWDCDLCQSADRGRHNTSTTFVLLWRSRSLVAQAFTPLVPPAAWISSGEATWGS